MHFIGKNNDYEEIPYPYNTDRKRAENYMCLKNTDKEIEEEEMEILKEGDEEYV